MQALIQPVVIFDFKLRKVFQVGHDPRGAERLAEFRAKQGDLIATASGSPADRSVESE